MDGGTMRIEEIGRDGLAGAFGRLADGFARLLGEHLALARVELRAEARAYGKDALAVAAFLPALLLGYALCMVALSLALGALWGTAWGFVAVGAANLVPGAVGAGLAIRRLRRRGVGVLEETREQARKSMAMISPQARPGATDGREPRLGA
jgi:hypothetical protein